MTRGSRERLRIAFERERLAKRERRMPNLRLPNLTDLENRTCLRPKRRNGTRNLREPKRRPPLERRKTRRLREGPGSLLQGVGLPRKEPLLEVAELDFGAGKGKQKEELEADERGG